MNKPLESPIDMPTIGKVAPAVEGEVTMQQLLDAMAYMAHDIDVLRAQVVAMVDKAGAAHAAAVGLTTEAERIFEKASADAERVHAEALVIAQASTAGPA